jgi:P-type Mg2+ transporter
MKEKSQEKFSGLTSDQARQKLKEYGENSIYKQKRVSPVFIFLGKLKNPLLLLLIAVSLVSFSLGQKTSAIIILAMVLLSAILDFLNSYRSQTAVEKLISKVTIRANVMRDGEKQEIDFNLIVPGDLVYLSAGNIVPADCIVLESDDFFVNQSSLTGESIPVEKIPVLNENNDNKITADSLNTALMGTSVISGFATVRVMKTGAATSYGKIAGALSKAEVKTDFEKSLSKFSSFILKVVFSMVSVVFVVYLLKNAEHLTKELIIQTFTFALAITIGVTPDMLPAIITLCLTKGSKAMAKKDVIVKHLSAIENFGSMDILCTDKTGTLTKDHITLVKHIDYNGKESERILELGYLSSFFHTGVTNPLDSAIKEHDLPDIAKYEKIDEIPYDFTRKRSSMVVEVEGKRILITKGAPEEIFTISKLYESSGKTGEFPGIEKNADELFKTLSRDGFRVLALAYKELPIEKTNSYNKSVENEMIFLGFLAFLDPPKEGVNATISELKDLGIEVKIITGDNDLLAQKICRDLGITITGTLNGPEISDMNDLELTQKALAANIFARVTPDQKERIILLLKKSGKSVGFLGDGINDAPALKVADVGISVDNAVDIAKETASIILMQKSLESLKDGVMEGRKTFHNTLKYILMGMSSNFGNMFSMMGASAFLPFLPMLPSQILFNNFIYDASQFSLPSDSVDENELRKPAHWDIAYIRSYMLVFGLISSVFDFLTFFLLYYVYKLSEHQFQTGWFIESIATQIFVIYIIRTKKIPFLQSNPSLKLFISTFIAVVFAWIVQFTFLGRMLMFDRLPAYIMLIIASYVLIYLVLVQISKSIFYRHHNKIKALKI